MKDLINQLLALYNTSAYQYVEYYNKTTQYWDSMSPQQWDKFVSDIVLTGRSDIIVRRKL